MSRLLLIRLTKHKPTFEHIKFRPVSPTENIDFIENYPIVGDYYVPMIITIKFPPLKCKCVDLAVDLVDLSVCNGCPMKYSADYARILLGMVPENTETRRILDDLLKDCKQIDLIYMFKKISCELANPIPDI